MVISVVPTATSTLVTLLFLPPLIRSAEADLYDVFKPCGIINHDESRLGCHEAVETNCTSMVHLSRLCPQECPYVAPHPELSCVFECAYANKCSRANPSFAFPNNESYVCEDCDVVGCKQCSTKTTCVECFSQFWLELGGTVCAYWVEDSAKHGLHAAAAFGLVFFLLATLVILILDHCNCLPRQCLPQDVNLAEDQDDAEEEMSHDATGESSGDPLVAGRRETDGEGTPVRSGSNPSEGQGETDPTLRALKVGNQHRLRCKIKDLIVSEDFKPGEDHRLQGPDTGEPVPEQPSAAGGISPNSGRNSASSLARFRKIPWMADLQAKYLVGVGLPLFHQWYYFLILYSALLSGGTAWIYYGSDLSTVLQSYGVSHARDVLMGQDTLRFCSMRNRKDDLGAAVREFARRCEVGYVVLWFLALIMSLVFAVRQKRVAAAFHQRHPNLAEFVLNVEGFPPEAIDEGRIRNFLRDSFGSEALEVSVCYDFRSRRERVHELLDKILVQHDVNARTYDAELTGQTTDPFMGSLELGLTEGEKEEVRSWLDPSIPGGLRNAGSVFVVLPHNYDLQLARRKLDAAFQPVPVYREHSRTTLARSVSKNTSRPPILPHSTTPEWLPLSGGGGKLKWVRESGPISELVIRDVVCEPPDVVWDHLGMETPRLVGRVFLGSLVIGASYVFIAAVIFVPLAEYAITFMDKAGSFPTGVLMTIVGTLQMTATWLICLLHIFVSSRVGFARRDREGLLIFKAFAVLCLVGFLFNVTITIFPESTMHGGDQLTTFFQPLTTGRAIDSIKQVSFQVRSSVHLLHVLVPGTLFIGYLIWPLQGFVWPHVSNWMWLRWWHRKNWTSVLSARSAELALEPLGMSIGHDYMGTIVQPVSCSLALFFASGVAWQVFGFLALWAAFQIPWQRYLHLRAVRRVYHTTNRLDTEVLFWWGFPLSLLLAGSAFWGARLRGWPLLLVPAAWAVGLAVWVILIAFAVRPLSLPKEEGHACHRPSYDEVRAQRFYDWHNCNPIKVLLSHCEEGATRAIPPFVAGKEYLQTLDPSWHARMRKLKCNTGPEVDSSVWGRVRNLQVPEVETFVQRPLESILGLMARRPSGNSIENRAATTPERPQHGRTPPASRKPRTVGSNSARNGKTTARTAHSARSPPTRSTPEEEDTPVSQEAQSGAAVVPASAAGQDAGSATVPGSGADSGAGPSLSHSPRPRCESADPGFAPMPLLDVEGPDSSPSSRGYGRYL